MKNRYFIVCYNFPGGSGNFAYVTEKGLYINKKQITEEYKARSGGIEDFVITNIIELSEEDYDYFYSGN